ncbi:MAG: hypothetical protein WKF97_20095 [Chitinophagaceae bacterium]
MIYNKQLIQAKPKTWLLSCGIFGIISAECPNLYTGKLSGSYLRNGGSYPVEQVALMAWNFWYLIRWNDGSYLAE